MLSRLVARRPELSDTWSVFLAKPPGFAYTAGDYTELELDYPPRGGRRWFSLSSAPHEEQLRITFRLPQPHTAFKDRLMKLQPGDQVQLAPAMGNFNLPRQPRPVLLVAAGVGATPYRSIISQLDKDNRLRDWDLTLLHAAAAGDYLFEDVFGRLGQRYLQVDPAQTRLDAAEIGRLVPDAADRMIYFAGPEPLAAVWHDQFLTAGFPRARLRLSYFPGYKGIKD